jgi:magnesium-transporting ATPase (P-type)
VGIALAGHGGGITAEAADVVILNDNLLRVAEAVSIGQRTMRIARQSIWVGLALSGAGMLVASAGMITPVFGALLQELIDVAVIVNALRTSIGDSMPSHQPMPTPELASVTGLMREYPTEPSSGAVHKLSSGSDGLPSGIP